MALFRRTSRYLSAEARRSIKEPFRIQRIDGSPAEFKAVPLSQSNKAALDHFDRFYSHAYGPSSWSVMRVALLAPPFKVAVLNRYCPKFDAVATSGIGAFHLDLIDILQKCQHVPYTTHELSASSNHRIPTEDCVGLEKDLPDQLDLSRQYLTRASGPVSELASLSEFVPVTELVSESEVFTRECDDDVTFSSAIGNTPHLPNCGPSFDAVKEDWNLPKSLRVKCPRKGRVADFIRPQAVDRHFDFYPMDLGSIIAVLALNLSPQDTLLDLCAAPGGKAVAALQTLQLQRLVCVDNSSSRLLRLRQVLATHGHLTSEENPKVHIVHESHFPEFLRSELAVKDRLFTKVLVDVPCSADRHALHSSEGSMFSKGKSKTRGSLPDQQLALLRRAMQLCRPGGSVVYSTCTLSPAQNQAIIETCLTKSNSQATFSPVDLTPLIHMFTMAQPALGLSVLPIHVNSLTSAPIGLLVVPRISANYGPTFVCKLRRVS